MTLTILMFSLLLSHKKLHCPTFLSFFSPFHCTVRPFCTLSLSLHCHTFWFIFFYLSLITLSDNFLILKSLIYITVNKYFFFPLDIEPFTQSGAEQTLKKESTRKFAKMFMNFIWSQYIVQKLTSAVQDMSELDYCMAVHDRSE